MRLLICCLLLFILCSAASAAEIIIKHLSVDDGLPKSYINHVTKDSDGFIWIATNKGLCRYDGYNFKIFKSNPIDTNSVSDDKIKYITEDYDGNLWIGTQHGLNKFNKKKETFRRYFHSNANPKSLSNDVINVLFCDRNGEIWIGTESGFCRYNKGEDTFERFGFNDLKDTKLSVISFAGGKDNTIWIGLWEEGLYNFNPHKSIFKKYSTKFPSLTVNSILADENKLWLGTWNKGIQLFDLETQKFVNYQPVNQLQIKHPVRKILKDDKRKQIWFIGGSDLGCINLSTGETRIYIHNPNDEYSLSKGIPDDLFLDDKGILWIPNTDGIDYYDPKTSQFEGKYHNLSVTESTTDNIWIRHAVEDKKGNIWFCTFNHGLIKYNPKNQKIKNYTFKSGSSTSLSSNSVLHASFDKKGYIWVGTDSGLDVFDPISETVIKKYSQVPGKNSLISNEVNYTYCDTYGNLWIATVGGLNYLDIENDSILNFSKNSLRGLCSFTINSVYEDRDGIIWANTSEGLAKFNRNELKFDCLTGNSNPSTSLKNVDCTFSYEDSKGNFWVGTRGGLAKLEKIENDYVFSKVTIQFPGDEVLSIVENKNGDLVVLTSVGISIVKPESLQISSYGKPDGLNINNHCFVLSRTGYLYCGHDASGYFEFKTEDIIINEDIPPVFITNFSINNQPVSINNKENPSPLDESIIFTDFIELSFKQSFFSLEFSALNYTLPKKNKYAYILEGFDENWNYVESDRRFATYTKVRPGEYTFKLKASNNDNIWNDVGKHLIIKINPPFWRTKYAYALYLIVFVLLLFVSRQISIKKALLEKNLEIEKMSREHENNLHVTRLRFFTNISHELRTPLTLILGPAQKLLADENLNENARKKIELINRSSKRLYNLISQILDFRKMETSNLKLSIQKNNIIEFIRLIYDAFTELAEEREVKYRFISEIESHEIWFDKDKIEKILYNLISNAFKFTPRLGEISVKVSVAKEDDSEFLKIEVIDSGIGIEKENITKLFTPFYQANQDNSLRKLGNLTGTGIGLALTKNLVELHYGKVEVESIFNKGSKFAIYIPLDEKTYKQEDFDEINNADKEKLTLSNKLYMPQVFHSEDVAEETDDDKNVADAQNSNDKKVILIVEDNPDMLHFINECLNEQFQIIEATNGLDAFKKAVKYGPDLIVSDVMMPKMDGLELTDKIKNEIKTSHIPVILLSAKSTIEEQKQGWSSGADAYVTKPFDADLLNIQIQKIIETRQMLQNQFTGEFEVKPHDVTINSLDKVFLDKVITLIENNISEEELSITYLTTEIGISKTHLYRKLKSLTGRSTSDFIRTIKIKRAAQFIKAGYNASESMMMVGINSRPYFIKCFKEVFGTTPSEYAKNLKAEK